MNKRKTGIERLIDLGDKEIRKDIGEYYIVSKSRMENLIFCIDNGAKRIEELSNTIIDQQGEIKALGLALCELEEDHE